MGENVWRQRMRSWAAHPGSRLLPLLAALPALGAVFIGATARGAPWPLDVAGVFVAVGAVASLVERRPVVGASFVILLAAAVVTVLYVLP